MPLISTTHPTDLDISSKTYRFSTSKYITTTTLFIFLSVYCHPIRPSPQYLFFLLTNAITFSHLPHTDAIFQTLLFSFPLQCVPLRNHSHSILLWLPTHHASSYCWCTSPSIKFYVPSSELTELSFCSSILTIARKNNRPITETFSYKFRHNQTSKALANSHPIWFTHIWVVVVKANHVVHKAWEKFR